MLNAKKKVASMTGESKVGRATLIKLLGEDADNVVSALKSAVTKLDSHAQAKELKKVFFKWLLKASVLINNKDLNKENTQHLREPLQMWAERLVAAYEKNPQGKRSVSGLSQGLKNIGVLLEKLLEPLAQEKNVDKITLLFNYYADPTFLHNLFNKPEVHEEAETIVESIQTILVPFPSVMHNPETIRLAGLRKNLLEQELSSPSFAHCLSKENPGMGIQFSKFLENQDGEIGTLFRFMLAEVEFSCISSTELRSSRAAGLSRKYRKSFASHFSSLLPTIDENISSQSVSKNVFAAAREAAQNLLEERFDDFLMSQEYVTHQKAMETELDDLLDGFGDSLS